MAQVVRYTHHGVTVAVRGDMLGRHREMCLCWNGCKFFRPDQEDNCSIAAALYLFDKEHHVTTPVFECERFQAEGDN